MQALKGKGKGGKERGDWGEKERDTRLKNPLWYENDQYPFFMLWMGARGAGGGGGNCGNTKGGPNLSLAIPYIPGSFTFFLGLLPLALS